MREIIIMFPDNADDTLVENVLQAIHDVVDRQEFEDDDGNFRLVESADNDGNYRLVEHAHTGKKDHILLEVGEPSDE